MLGSRVPEPVVRRLRAAGCVFAEDEARLLAEAAGGLVVLEALVKRRESGVPLEHVVGWAEFCGLRIVVEPGVFVPRRRSEFLVRTAAALAPARAIVLDLCCGSGALGRALAEAADVAELHAADVDPTALRCARRNLADVGGAVYAGDLVAPLPSSLRGRVDVLLANVPYVPTGEIPLLPPEAREHEPRVALDGGEDGLDVLRRVAGVAPEWLAPGGHVLVETSERQAPVAARILLGAGLASRIASSADLGSTVVIAAQ